MIRIRVGLASVAALLVLTACSKGANTAKSDSAAADSIRAAHAAAAADSAAAAVPMSSGSHVDSVKPPVNSTAGTIGETRKTSARDTMGRDSVIHGPYKTMDSLGRIKR